MYKLFQMRIYITTTYIVQTNMRISRNTVDGRPRFDIVSFQ